MVLEDERKAKMQNLFRIDSSLLAPARASLPEKLRVISKKLKKYSKRRPRLSQLDSISLESEETIAPFFSIEFALTVFFYFEASELYQFSLVSKSWYDIISNPLIWQRLCIIENIDLGPGIEILIDDETKKSWWKRVYQRGKNYKLNWKQGNCKILTNKVCDVRDCITRYDLG